MSDRREELSTTGRRQGDDWHYIVARIAVVILAVVIFTWTDEGVSISHVFSHLALLGVIGGGLYIVDVLFTVLWRRPQFPRFRQPSRPSPGRSGRSRRRDDRDPARTITIRTQDPIGSPAPFPLDLSGLCNPAAPVADTPGPDRDSGR
jgi:hypothetical protein